MKNTIFGESNTKPGFCGNLGHHSPKMVSGTSFLKFNISHVMGQNLPLKFLGQPHTRRAAAIFP
jgi:hypothetical protein